MLLNVPEGGAERKVVIEPRAGQSIAFQFTELVDEATKPAASVDKAAEQIAVQGWGDAHQDCGEWVMAASPVRKTGAQRRELLAHSAGNCVQVVAAIALT